ncbi:MAG: cytochrome c oxidase subunit 3, partial [Betaproteobacteria bacterium]|nr:cytochrome c oxidase subunit 3 [Betaproteobacteria bacterium]
MSVASSGSAPYYFVPAPSKWPLVGSISMLFFMFGMSGLVNGAAYGPYAMAVGFAILVYMFFGWFGVVIHESEAGRYNHRVDASFRWSMGWFIFSEVMFFAGFFGALFYARTISMPWLGDLDHKAILWPDFSAHWPNNGPAGLVEPFQTMGPFWIPTINTALLLSSGVTLTIAHHALRENHREKVLLWLAITVLLGAVFMGCQAYEYAHAYADLNLKLSSGIFGSTFYMLTGF